LNRRRLLPYNLEIQKCIISISHLRIWYEKFFWKKYRWSVHNIPRGILYWGVKSKPWCVSITFSRILTNDHYSLANYLSKIQTQVVSDSNTWYIILFKPEIKHKYKIKNLIFWKVTVAQQEVLHAVNHIFIVHTRTMSSQKLVFVRYIIYE